MGDVICGNQMAIDGVSSARKFAIRKLNRAPSFVASNTKGGTGRILGPKDFTGVYSAYGHTPAVFPGADFSFSATTDGAVGVEGDAIVDKVEISWDCEQGGLIEQMVYFSGDGALSEAANTTTDTTAVVPVSALAMQASFGTLQTNVRKMKLVISARNKPYCTDQTAGWVKRNKGPIDAQVAVGVYTACPSDLPAIGSYYETLLYVGASTYWAIKWMHILGYDDFTCDHEGDENVSAVILGGFSGFYGGAAGSIITPAGTTKWPSA